MTRLVAAVSLLMALAIITAGPALGADYTEFLEAGKAQYEAGQYEAAASELQSALSMDPEGREALLYMGMTERERGYFDNAESYLMRALYKQPDDSRTLFEIARLYDDMGITVEAAEFYEGVEKMDPATALAREARSLRLAMPGQGERKKPWALSVSLGAQYDDNVIMIADDNPTPEGISSKSDWRTIATLGGSYTLNLSETVAGSASYSLYKSVHSDLGEYDVDAHSPALAMSWSAREKLRLRGSYGLAYAYLDGDDYSATNTFGLTAMYAWGGGHISVLGFEHAKSDFHDSARFPTNSERDGYVNKSNIEQHLPLGKHARLALGLQYSRAFTRAPWQEYSGYQRTASITVEDLPFKSRLALGAAYSNKLYGRENPSMDADYNRKDKTYTLTAGLTVPIRTWLELGLSYLFTKSDSNIDAYEYDRSVVGAALTARF